MRFGMRILFGDAGQRPAENLRALPQATSAETPTARLNAGPATDTVTLIAAHRTRQGLQKPEALQPGDTIALVLSGSPISRKHLQRHIDHYRARGYKVVSYARTDRFNRHYLSDTDFRRAEAINRAYRNPKVKAIFDIHGGAGAYRPDFLRALDWPTIRANPKIIQGFSDITFLLNAIREKGESVVFHAKPPHPECGLRNAEALWAMIEKTADQPAGQIPAPVRAGKNYRCLSAGEARGVLVGGNLTLMANTVGTPYETDLTGKILVLEDWKEGYETVDRLFSQLIQRGMFEKIAGLILGEFVQVPVTHAGYGFNRQRFFSDLVREARVRGIPVGFNFPVGHGIRSRPLPFGIEAKFNSATGTLTFLESPVRQARRASVPPQSR